jgi:hypothetical protein
VTGFAVVYDASVLYPSTLRDLLIRIAMSGLVRAKWTDQILDEVFGAPTSGTTSSAVHALRPGPGPRLVHNQPESAGNRREPPGATTTAPAARLRRSGAVSAGGGG